MPILADLHSGIEHQGLRNLLEIVQQLPVLGIDPNGPKNNKDQEFWEAPHCNCTKNSPATFTTTLGSGSAETELESPRLLPTSLKSEVLVSMERGKPPGP